MIHRDKGRQPDVTGHPTAPGSGSGSSRERRDEARLRVQADANGGLVPVPFVGTLWHSRGGAYWRRRIGGTLVLMVGTAFVGGISTGVAIGILGSHPNATRIAIAAIYVATVLPGLMYGWRIVRRMPLDARSGPRNPFGGCLVVLITPFVTGLCLAILFAALRPQFLGETRARALSSPSSLR